MAFVNAHSRLVGDLNRRSSPENSRSRNSSDSRKKWNSIAVIKTFYDAGSVVVVIGQILGFGGLCWCLFHVFYRSQNQLSAASTPTNWKRSIPATVSSSNSVFPMPLIPGITLPLSHAFPIFLSMIVCTTLHELGHALVAAIDGVPLLSWGYNLIVIIPTAFVELALSPDYSTGYKPLSLLRISAAGAFHNLLTLAVLYLASFVSIGRIFWGIIGYFIVSQGAVVVNVSEGSPLQPFLPSGSLITHLDDMPLIKTSNASMENIWDNFLLMDTAQVDAQYSFDTRLGWCVEGSWFNSYPTTCCPLNLDLASISNLTISNSCFISQLNPGHGHCIDPVPLFENRTVQRCTSDATCNARNTDGNICISPHPSTSLLRVSIKKNADTARGKVIVWSGPRKEIWEQVTIGTYLPRFPLFPVGLPMIGALLFEYLKAVSISLFFFNILPIRLLDGGQILQSFLDILIIWKFGHESMFGNIDLEQGDGSSRIVVQDARWRRRARWLEKWIERITIILVLAVLFGGAAMTGIEWFH